MNLVLIETSGNQAFIFATNKLRENVGASELTAQTGTHFVLEAVQEAGGLTPVREDLRKAEAYPALSADNPFEIILAISGKALLLVKNAELGRQIVRSVTSRALKEAPGLEVRGVVSRDFDDQKDCLHSLIGEVHREYEKVRSRLRKIQRADTAIHHKCQSLRPLRFAPLGSLHRCGNSCPVATVSYSDNR